MDKIAIECIVLINANKSNKDFWTVDDRKAGVQGVSERGNRMKCHEGLRTRRLHRREIPKSIPMGGRNRQLLGGGAR